MTRLPGVWAVCGLWLALQACGPAPQAEKAPADTVDSTTVVLSKYYSSRNYRHWLGDLQDSLGGPPLRFVQAYGLDSAALETALAQADAVVLTGGEDIHPARYGQPADTERCGRIDVERDRVEHALLDGVVARKLPCLGVCRGLQVMNVHGGGTLRPHLPDDGFEGHRGGVAGNSRDTLHPVSVTQPWSWGSQAFDLGETAMVVSHHHQGIGRLAPDFEVWLTSPDGLAEGIRWADTTASHFWVGVQYHPERSAGGHGLTDGLGVALLEAAKRD